MREFKLPDLGEGLTEAEIVEWHVAANDDIKLNQPLLSVETDKAVVEVPSPVTGRVISLHGEAGVSRIGARSNVQDSAVIHCTPSHPTIVGDGVTIGQQAHLEGCTVLDGSLIGVGAVVMHDARIGPDALVGANATVTSGTLVPAQAMALGTPARIRENAVDPDHNQRNAEIYAQRGHHYRAEQRRID